MILRLLNWNTYNNLSFFWAIYLTKNTQKQKSVKVFFKCVSQALYVASKERKEERK